MEIKEIKEQIESFKQKIQANLSDKQSFNDEKANENKELFAKIEGLKTEMKKEADVKFNKQEIKKESFMENDNLVDSFNKLLKAKAGFGHAEPELVQKFATITSGSGSGILVPESVGSDHVIRRNSNKVLAHLAYHGQPIITSALMEVYKVPVYDDSANAAHNPAEDASSDTAAEPSVAGLELNPTLYSSKSVWLSETAVGAHPNLQSEVIPMLLKRIELKRDKDFFDNVIANADVAITTADENSVTYAEMLDLVGSLETQYITDASLFVSRTFWTAMKKSLLDGNDRTYLYQENGVWKFEGLPVFVTDNLQATGTFSNIAAAVASAECTKYYRAGGTRIKIYTDIPSKPDQIGFCIFENGDQDFIDAGVKVLKLATS